jgi:hypothetical protein
MFLHHYANAIWSFEWLEGLHLYVLVTFIHQKKFNHIAKTANIFHFKLGDSPNHFPTSTPSKYTSNHHGQLIASDRFLT